MSKYIDLAKLMVPALIYNVIDYNYFITEQITFSVREILTICQTLLLSLGILI